MPFFLGTGLYFLAFLLRNGRRDYFVPFDYGVLAYSVSFFFGTGLLRLLPLQSGTASYPASPERGTTEYPFLLRSEVS